MSTKSIDAKPTTHWHTLTVEQSLQELESGPSGLGAAEAARRLAEFGPNELQAQGRVSPWAILLEQFKNVLIIILLLATALSAFLGHGVEAIAITVIVLFAVILGFIQELFWEQLVNTNGDERDRLLGHVQATYQLNDWISVLGRVGRDWYRDHR
jgi:Ca2+-transporting ATPase